MIGIGISLLGLAVLGLARANAAVEITASRTSGTAPAGVLFEAVPSGFGVSRPFHDLHIAWDFGDEGDWSNLPANHPQGQGRSKAYGPLTSHVFREPGTYTVTCTVTNGVVSKTVTQEITVADPDAVFPSAQTYVVSPTSDFTDAPAGATQYTNYVTAFNDAVAESQDIRVLLHRGEDHRTGTPALTRFDNDNRLFIGAYGTGARPIIDRNIRLGENNAMDSEVAIHGIEFRGGYDAAAFPDVAPDMGEGITRSVNMNADLTVFDCLLTGIAIPLRENNGSTGRMIVADTEITNWQDFGCLAGDTAGLAWSGVHIHQKPDAVMGGKKGDDNHPDHGPLRVSAPPVGGHVSIRHSNFFTVGGWADIDQQCIRWNSNGVRGVRAVFDGNLLEGGQQQFALFRTAESGGLATSSPGDVIVQRNLCVMSPGSTFAAVIGYGGTTFRNNVTIRPAVETSPLSQDSAADPNGYALGWFEDEGRQDTGTPANHDSPIRVHHNQFIDLASDAQVFPSGGTTLTNTTPIPAPDFWTDFAAVGNILHAPNRTNAVTIYAPFQDAVLSAPRYAQWRGAYDITVGGTTYTAGTAYPAFATPSDTISLYQPSVGSPALSNTPPAALGDFFGTLRGGKASDTAEPTPILFDETASATGQTVASGSVGVTKASTVDVVWTTSATPPSHAQIQAGQDHTGSPAAATDLDIAASAETVSFSATGLSENTTYYAHIAAEDAAGNAATPVTTGAITTDALSYLLDDHPTGATTALSLRQLKSTTTDVVRVRRDGDDAEQDFTATEIRDGTLVAFCNAGGGNGYTRTLYDQEGTNNANQATSANQPQIVDTGALITTANGEPAMRWDGSSTSMLLDCGTPLMLASTAFSMFMLVERQDGTADSQALYSQFSEAQRCWLNADSGPGYTFFHDAVSGTNPFFSPTVALGEDVVSLIRKSTLHDYELIVNGVSEATASVSDTSPEQVSTFIGGETRRGANPFTGLIAEIIHYDADKTAEQSAIEADIAEHYGVTIAPNPN